jgi:antitoxin (DNA-binding transcriptional repressor) of toxin-antitoxin stability system
MGSDTLGRAIAMERIGLADAERHFSELVQRVYSEGIVVELDRGDRVVARISPATPSSPLKVRDLNSFLQSLPRLGEDAEAFREDLRTARHSFPAERDPWA